MKLLEREAGVRLAFPHQQRIDIFLGASLGPLARLFCHEHDRTHEFVLPVPVGFEWGREKRAVGITVLVSQAVRGRANVRGNPLSSYTDPVAVQVCAALMRKRERLEGCCRCSCRGEDRSLMWRH
jgi:hypothetical protein